MGELTWRVVRWRIVVILWPDEEPCVLRKSMYLDSLSCSDSNMLSSCFEVSLP